METTHPRTQTAAIHEAVDAAMARLAEFPARYEGRPQQLLDLRSLCDELGQLVQEHPCYLTEQEKASASAFVAAFVDAILDLVESADTLDGATLAEAAAEGPDGLADLADSLDARLSETRELRDELEALELRLQCFELQKRCLDHYDMTYHPRRAEP